MSRLSFLGKYPRLSPEEKGLCEGKLFLQECWDAINTMKNGKSPVKDGLTKEFYTAFFGELGSLLLKTFSYSFVKGWRKTDGSLCFTCREDNETLCHFFFDCLTFKPNSGLLWCSLLLKASNLNAADGTQI